MYISNKCVSHTYCHLHFEANATKRNNVRQLRDAACAIMQTEKKAKALRYTLLN